MERAEAVILMIEDHPDLRDGLALWLGCHGWAVVTAEDGEQALDLLVRQRPDLILTDLRMPKVDGVELIRRVRRNPTTAHIPIVVMSADDGALSEASAAGALITICKPLDFDCVLETVSRILSTRRGVNQQVSRPPAVTYS